MSFRDDRDALLERVEGLERENEAARRERDEARRSAADVPKLEARLREAEDELAVRRRGESPRIQRLVVLGGISVVAVLAAAGALVTMDLAGRGREVELARRQAAAALRERDSLDERLALVESQAAELRRQHEADRQEREAATRVAPAVPLPDTVTTRVEERAERTTARVQTAHVTHATGAAPVRRGAPCDVTLTAEVDDCRARVRCGEVGLYPDPGREGFFACEFDREGPVHGADVRRTELSGDPRLDFDRARGTLEISDGVGEAAWAVTLRLDR